MATVWLGKEEKRREGKGKRAAGEHQDPEMGPLGLLGTAARRCS